MKISYSWLQQYIDLDIEPNKLSELLTDGGLEVEGLEKVESIKGGLKGIFIGNVLSCEKHPNADKLSITKVDVGNGTILPIVCGAPNVAKGQKVLVATIGTFLYDGDDSFKIKKSKIRGEESEGMICAEDELGLGTSHDGIMVLPEEAVVGQAASEYFDVREDWVYEIGLTPNRADATSHIGSARDLVAVINRFYPEKKLKLNIPNVSLYNYDKQQSLPINVKVEDNTVCPRYSGVCISNIEIKESPEWLQNRLKSIGLRPINNIVDITNYVLMETGQPLHAFDYDKIEDKKIVVKTIEKDSLFTTLDDQERKLTENDLMICSGTEPMCFAGVFGGKTHGVNDETTNIFLESAYFDSVSVRKTSKHHNLKTDASFRFERGADPKMIIYALQRAALMIQDLAGGDIASEIIDIYPTPIEDWTIKLRYSQLDRLIGQKIERSLVKSILIDLDIKIIEETETELTLLIPTFKVDVLREADIIEEVLRVYGYNQITLSNQIHSSISFSDKPDLDNTINTVSDFLVAKGYTETMNNSLTKSDYNSDNTFIDEEINVNILNPLSSELNILRQSLLFGGLETISRNIKFKQTDIKTFEFGNQYWIGDKDSDDVTKKYLQETHLSLFLSGNKFKESWNTNVEEQGFFDMKSMIQQLIIKLGINPDHIKLKELDDDKYSYGINISIKKVNIASIGKLSKKLLDKLDINQNVFFGDVNWTKLFQLVKNYKVKYTELPKYPSVRRDLALLIDYSVKYTDLEKTIKNAERNYLKEVNLFDVYEGKGIPKGKKSYALSFTLQDENKTMTDKVIDKAMDKILNSLKKEYNVELR